MAEEKVTRKELFMRIAETMKNDSEVVEMCEKYIEQLSRPKKKKVNEEMIALADKMANFMSEQPDTEFTNKELVTWYNEGAAEGARISSQKMAAVMRYLVGIGTVQKIVGERPSDSTKYQIA